MLVFAVYAVTRVIVGNGDVVVVGCVVRVDEYVVVDVDVGSVDGVGVYVDGIVVSCVCVVAAFVSCCGVCVYAHVGVCVRCVVVVGGVAGCAVVVVFVVVCFVGGVGVVVMIVRGRYCCACC